MNERRKFCIQLGSVMIMIPAASWLSACGGNEPAPGGNGTITGTLRFTSSIDGGHSHTVDISAETLANASAMGLLATASNEGGHTHTVDLSKDDMDRINGNAVVTIQTSTDAGHLHTFTFEKSRAQVT